MSAGTLAKKLWDVIVMHHNQGGRTKVEVHADADDILLALCCIAGNVISNVPSSADRERLLRTLGPQTDHFVNKIRKKPSIHIPSKSPLILPN